jgi:hypothetical protein
MMTGPKWINILPLDIVRPSQTAESPTWPFDPNGTSLIVQGDKEKSGTIPPAKDEEFTGSSPFLTLRSSLCLAGIFLIKSFDRTLPLKTLNFMMIYQRTAVIWWKIDKEPSFGLF